MHPADWVPMPRLTAFLRAINVGGHTVTMERLRGLFEALGFADVQTFIASGNVIFSSRTRPGGAMERRIENHLEAALGYEVATFVRSEEEVAAVAACQPFPPPMLKQAKAFCVGFLAQPLTPAGRRAVLGFRTDIDEFHVHGREVYWLCRRGQGESTFTNVGFERQVGVRVTFRSLTTVRKLADKFGFAAAGRKPTGA